MTPQDKERLKHLEQRLRPRSLERSLREFFFDVVRVAAARPRLLPAAVAVAARQLAAARVRRRQEKSGLHVPPMMIFSVTGQCNLGCKGCYSRLLQRADARELTTGQFSGVLSQAAELGISIVLLAGGEPLMRPDLFSVTARFRSMVFPVFTNGLLVDEKVVSEFRKQRHCIPVISLEGDESGTDERRGSGVFSGARGALERLRAGNVFYGMSITVTKENFARVTSEDFVSAFIGLGCGLFFYVEYVPVESGTARLTLDPDRRKAMSTLSARFSALHRRALFVSFPGDEEQFGGCLAAGKGFVHINQAGGIEPCPFAPFSDGSVTDIPLREALNSGYLAVIRANEAALRGTEGGCSLWEKRAQVRSLLDAARNGNVPEG